MRRLLTLSAALLAALGGVSSADPGERTSTAADQRAVGVTVYNHDLAVVRDRRHLTLPSGETRLALRDVSARIQPQTAVLQSAGTGASIEVVEQNFDYDLLTPQKLLEKYVGRDVVVIHPADRSGRRTRERARVLAANNGVVLRYGDRIETTVDGDLAYPAIPENLRDRPTLVTDLFDAHGGAQDVELDYLTNGMSWQADYTAMLAANDERIDLRGLITLHNESGTSYRDASVQLVAGDVNNPQPPRVLQQIGRTTADSYTVAQPREEGLLEYHLYTLPRRTTLADAQTKQVELLRAAAIPVTKTLELRGGGEYYQRSAGDLGERLKVGTYLAFHNDGGDLGVPLPGGTIRVYKRDAAGTAQFVGADTIDHTPRGSDVRLFLGYAFDLIANKKQTDFDSIAGNIWQSSYRIDIHNGKDMPQTVRVVETIPFDWTIVQTSAPYEKTSSATATWTVTVPANGDTILTYTAHVQLGAGRMGLPKRTVTLSEARTRRARIGYKSGVRRTASGFAAGFTLGYAAVRAAQALRDRRSPYRLLRDRDPRRYGAARRATDARRDRPIARVDCPHRVRARRSARPRAAPAPASAARAGVRARRARHRHPARPRRGLRRVAPAGARLR